MYTYLYLYVYIYMYIYIYIYIYTYIDWILIGFPIAETPMQREIGKCHRSWDSTVDLPGSWKGVWECI